MSSHGSPTAFPGISTNANEPALKPRRLELSLDPTDGSLRTAPLTHVILAATDALYTDLYNMAHGELVVTAAVAGGTDEDHPHEEENNHNNPANIQTKKERMSNLSFAQRRHELAWRLARHGKALQQVAALTAAAATTELSAATAASSTALQHARTAWVQADEAQDALFFFHARLFPGRASPHDIYGAADVQLAGRWFDLCRDMRLAVDPYDSAPESSWSVRELDDRWQMAVRRKLLLGEVGWMRHRQIMVPWKVSLRGGVVRFTHGNGFQANNGTSATTTTTFIANDNTTSATTTINDQYPIEALLTVVPSEQLEWSLLELHVRVQPKTGEFNYQLATSKRQQFDLHRLAALAMSRAEALARRQQREQQQKQLQEPTEADEPLPQEKVDNTLPPARPLHALFQVAHRFSISWQLEVLSAQAQGLRRGVWAAGIGNPIQVSPATFFTDTDNDVSYKQEDGVLGIMSISFWKVDDSYGPPSISCIARKGNEADEVCLNSKYLPPSKSQLVLAMQAKVNVGIQVFLSGASGIRDIMQQQPLMRTTVNNLLEAAANPLALSASDALLAATKLCAERKCHAVVNALCPTTGEAILPRWISVVMEHGSIVVAARVGYHSQGTSSFRSDAAVPVLFRLMCDARTGSFVPVFSRSLQLLRRLAGNDPQASEAAMIRIACLPVNRRRAAGGNFTGRCVRESFDGLVRCINVLGQRVGVGGKWDDIEPQSSQLRDRSIRSACVDVRSALMKCCAIAGLYGIGPLALATAVGLDAAPDL